MDNHSGRSKEQKRRTGMLINSDKLKKVLLVLLSLIMMFVVSACTNSEEDADIPTYEPVGQTKEYSIEERKALAEEAFLSEIYESLVHFGNPGYYAKVHYPNTRYEAYVKQVSETKYEVTCILYYFDKYDNLVGTASDVHGDVVMKADGMVVEVHAYDYFNVDWE